MTSPWFPIACLIVLLFAEAGSSQSNLHSCLVVAEGDGAPQRWAGSAADCATRLSPARKFYAGGLPVSKSHLDVVKGALEQAPGTVENARGVHPLAVRWRDGIALSSKTGATTTTDAARRILERA